MDERTDASMLYTHPSLATDDCREVSVNRQSLAISGLQGN